VSDTPQLGGIQWEQYDHQAMWDMVESADPKEMLSRANELDALAKHMGDNVNGAYRAMEKLMSTWSGTAADQAASVVQPLLNWASGAATTGSEIARRLGTYAEALNHARLRMPNPVDAQQLDAVADGGTATVNNLSLNEPELAAMANGDTATQAQATTAKNKAVEVMRQFEQESGSAYHGLPTFTRPPKAGNFPSPEPAPPGPPRLPGPPPRKPIPPTPPGKPQPPAQPVGPAPGANSGTTASDYAGPTGLGAVGSGGGATFGAGGASTGTGMGTGGVIGMPAFAGGAASGALSGAGDEAGSQGAAAMAAEEAEPGGWGGFAPMGMGGGRHGDQDGEHRNSYAKEPNLIGELPAAFPPVLGL
jgi:hypothetical protein